MTWHPRWRQNAARGYFVGAAVPGFLSVLLELPGEADRRAARRWLATWLVAWLNISSADIADEEVSFVYVVFRRVPEAADTPDGSITNDSAIAEAGVGAPPSAPDDWETCPARRLISAVSADLQG
jgi:hypothetical protein